VTMSPRRRRRWWTGIVAGLAAAGLAAGIALAGPGDPDPTFGTNGRLTIDLGGGDQATSLFLLPDGRMLMAGSGEANRELIGVRRLADGSPDPSYATDGGFFADFGGVDFGYDAAQTPDGKLVLVGTSFSGPLTSIVVLRRNADGSQDNTFNGNGRLILTPGDTNDAHGVAVQSDGKIIIVGKVVRPGGAKDAVVIRLMPNGTPDATFDGDGTLFIDLGGTEDARDVMVLPDGRIVVVGSTTASDDAFAVRLTPTGAFDVPFNNGVSIVPGPGSGQAESVLRQPDGKLVLIGSSNGAIVVNRIITSGSLDGGFGVAGTLRISVAGTDYGVAGVLQPDGTILLAGRTQGGSQDMVVARIQPGGTLDTTFGIGGIRTIDLGGTDSAGAIALRPDGRIVVAGSGGPAGDIAVARLDGDGQPAGTTPGGGGAGGAPGGPAPGTAIPRCAGLRATIVGTARRDVLRGTRRRDVIAGLAGDDVIRGLGGDDVICGGPGADTILGGPGADRLLGQAGRDALDGGAGRDNLAGGTGRDRCAGGAGRDHAACERSRTV
jgi:uncharacterized delta-60 repeat protein